MVEIGPQGIFSHIYVKYTFFSYYALPHNTLLYATSPFCFSKRLTGHNSQAICILNGAYDAIYFKEGKSDFGQSVATQLDPHIPRNQNPHLPDDIPL